MPSRMVEFKKSVNIKYWWKCEATGTLIHYWWECKWPTLRNNMALFNKIKHALDI